MDLLNYSVNNNHNKCNSTKSSACNMFYLLNYGETAYLIETAKCSTCKILS